MTTPIVWTIAGSDSGNGAGIQADLNTFKDFNVHGCTAITALTAQNSCGVTHIQATSLDNLTAQINALRSDMTPSAIKLGMLFQPSTIKNVSALLNDCTVPIIADPVFVSTNGDPLHSCEFINAYQQFIFPIATLITPNIHEAEMLTGTTIHTYDDMVHAARQLIHLGARAVLLKGGDLDPSTLASDFYCDDKASWWMNQRKIHTSHTHGTGCTLSAAIAAALAKGWPIHDALVLAKAYVHAGLHHPTGAGLGRQGIGHVGLSDLKNHFPWITDSPQPLPESFKQITYSIGRYPVVDNLQSLETLCAKGIKVIQLRIKDPALATEAVFNEALRITQAHDVVLYVNDHLHLAKQLHAPALHLGQEDILTAAIDSLERDQIFLGITAHNLFELAKGYAHHPSYLTMGPIFHTTSKQLPYPVVGMEKLAFVLSLCPLPLVAIGGISHEMATNILNLGCSGAAFIQASKQLMHDGRYDRHLLLPDFHIEHQQRLMLANIVCVGVGGLASGFLPYLAAAGVGSITLIDYDTIQYNNLQRQIMFREADVGQLKTETAERYLRSLNSQITIHSHSTVLMKENALSLLSGYDLIIDGTDNFDTHYLINDTAQSLQTPLIAAAVYQREGQLFYFAPSQGGYRNIFPEPSDCPNCDTAGILGTTPGLLGIMQAQLAIDVLIGNAPAHSICRTIDLSRWTVKTFTLGA